MGMDYVKKFCEDRNRLIANYSVWQGVKQVDNQSFPTIDLPSPELLANFSGYLKFQLKDKDSGVFCRGENRFFKSTPPSLFRPNTEDLDEDEIRRRIAALSCLVSEMRILYKNVQRFQSKYLRPFLQHYHIKTDWLDLVDNIFVALWFANYDAQKQKDKYIYVKFFSDSGLKVKDLRKNISSLSLRPNCQHGMLVTRYKKLTKDNINFNDKLIAVARLPKLTGTELTSEMQISKKFLFPDKDLDNTYKLLMSHELKEKIKEIEEKYGLAPETLGRVA